jgi:putative Mg2+ transporter-C (MgtC) family protein
MNPHENASVFALRLLVGALLGSAIGFERQWRQRAAGLQTSALVTTGATLFALLDSAFTGANSTRILANIVSGVGFLAGGVILRQGTSVSGLNTAATIWACAAVGALAGVGLFADAVMGAAAMIVLNLLMQPLVTIIDDRAVAYKERRGETTYRLHITGADLSAADLRMLVIESVKASPLNLHALSTESTDDGEEIRAEVVSLRRNDRAVEQLATELSKRHDVRRVTWRIPVDES